MLRCSSQAAYSRYRRASSAVSSKSCFWTRCRLNRLRSDPRCSSGTCSRPRMTFWYCSSATPNPLRRPAASAYSRSRARQSAWIVPRVIASARSPRVCFKRTAISSAARFVNVTAQMRSGASPRRSMRWLIRAMRQKVFPALGPMLVVAGPGAGKTFCLIARINHLIDRRGLAPERICAVTFTNRAAEEIAVRLKHTLGERAEAITRGTIHALCLALLREYAEAAGLRKGFGVADEQYQKVILGRLHVPLEQRGSLLNRFSRHRVQKQDFELTADDARLYREYAAWLAHRNMLDFDDLVSKAEELLRARGDLADAIAARWDYLLVDEFQDVNAVQYDLLKRLAAPHGNFFAVGDDEQSIFTWTGADPYVLVRIDCSSSPTAKKLPCGA